MSDTDRDKLARIIDPAIYPDINHLTGHGWEASRRAADAILVEFLPEHDKQVRDEASVEYGLDYGAGVTNVGDDPADAEEMQQWIPGSVVVKRTVHHGEWEDERTWEQFEQANEDDQ